MVSARGKSTVQTSVTGLVMVASRGRFHMGGVGANLTGALIMQPRDDKAAELYLAKRKTKKRLILLKTCFSVIKVLVQIFTLIDKYWLKITAFFV